ncbi:hypothetical protein THASP1DRAFT_28826 [Thamnocephalis sphaerospora]|uniref:enoyl-[acyl-carrier-protein] reductase n=1 Tax=Thamnocephalis sphaerospora TaxID=78915 RepID=A0A4P9XTB2_9FUNG|nr:hypothetical protein THASP1DRAFT_28826 [Thamnocephalis sphaerospora]|eukprot:RKP09376.1 hypothetical protein THASP1DRAFT_28826 [Thamnocephalis sphaerospora]
MLAIPLRKSRETLASFVTRRFRTTLSRCVTFENSGRPTEVLRITEVPLPPLTDTTLHLRFLAAPVNPADINQVEGVYPISARSLPDVDGFIGGNEGVAEVVAVGERAAQQLNVQPGDWVLPAVPAFGTWRTYAAAEIHEVQKIPKEGLTALQAATLAVNPCTAYRMLKDFVQLQPGDTVVQNGANSAVGQAVIQIARAWGIRTLNVIRDRPNLEELSRQLRDMGADWVIRDTDLRSAETRALFASGNARKPFLALNCVGGKAATDMLRLLGNGGSFVTYGAMSRQPLTLPASAFIFKDISAHGYWMTRWMEDKREGRREERAQMLNELIGMLRAGTLWPPIAEVTRWGHELQLEASLDSMRSIVTAAGAGLAGKKQVMLMHDVE